MFRMASNLKPEEGGMDEILQTNDDLLRVMDTYKRVVGVGEDGGGGGGDKPTQNGGEPQKSEGTKEVPEEAGAAGGGTMPLGTGGGGDNGDVSTLIDLAGLDFGLPATSVAPVNPSTTDSLLDSLGTLGNQCFKLLPYIMCMYRFKLPPYTYMYTYNVSLTV